MISRFIRRYKIDLGEFQRERKEDYLTFKDFFTREIKSELRAILGPKNAAISPVDGIVVAYGNIDCDTIIQLKNSHYSLHQLVNENDE